MIIVLHPGQPELRLSFSGRRFRATDGLRLVIRRAGENPALWSEMRFTGFWPGHDPAREARRETGEPPALVYPLFDIGNEGELVFRFDSLLWRLEPGRYIGLVESADGGVITELDLDLWPEGRSLRRAEAVELEC